MGEIRSKAINEALPIPIPGLLNEIKEIAKQAAGLLESGVKSQTDKVVDKFKEPEKK